MLDISVVPNLNFAFSDNSIHKLATAILLSKETTEVVLTEEEYSYKVKGGGGGYLYYRKGSRKWVLIADWCFYGLYIVIRYRKPLWLRPMYQSLFASMNFGSVAFGDNSIEAVGTEGEVLRSRRFRLSPPYALEEVMAEKFGYSKEKAADIKVKLNLSLN